MKDSATQLRRLICWNRFWLIIVVLGLLIGAGNYEINRLIADSERLYLTWSISDAGEQALCLSSNGGPFIVTHLVISSSGAEDIDTALGATAELPHPLYVRGPKARTYISARELANLTWTNSEGQKIAAPKPGSRVLALFYAEKRVTTTK